MDGLWIFLTICGVAAILAEAYETRVKTRAKFEASNKHFDELADRIAAIEKRIENLETIVVDSSKHREFDRSLKE